MKSIRRRVFTLVLFLILTTMPIATIGAQQLQITAGISWDLALRGGITYMFSPNLGIKTDIGYSPFSGEGNLALTYDLLFIVKQQIPGSDFSFGAYIGLPTGYFVFTEPISLMNALGASVFGSYSITEQVNLSLRLGSGYPIFFKDNQWSSGETRFFLGLWPDLVLELGFSL